MNLIKKIEQEEIARLGRTVPDFAPGDTVIVNVNVVEGDRKRIQAYEGVVVAKRNRGLNSSFIVRKMRRERRLDEVFTHGVRFTKLRPTEGLLLQSYVQQVLLDDRSRVV